MNCEKKSFFEMIGEEGPVIWYNDNGRKVFIFNPYYKGKDPLKEIFWSRHQKLNEKGVKIGMKACSTFHHFHM